jgi:hypothetical protein
VSRQVKPQLAAAVLAAHQNRQAREREAAGEAWHDNNLVFCHENGDPYTSEGLNWQFSKMTKKAGIGHWHAHEGRHTAVSIMSVYRHVIVPQIRGGATIMDTVLGDSDDEEGDDPGNRNIA